MPCNARLQGLEVKMDTHSARQKSMRSSLMGGHGSENGNKLIVLIVITD